MSLKYSLQRKTTSSERMFSHVIQFNIMSLKTMARRLYVLSGVIIMILYVNLTGPYAPKIRSNIIVNGSVKAFFWIRLTYKSVNFKKADYSPS